jgi:hypothetical protein
VAGVGVRLVEAPDAPSRGQVHVRIPSGPRCSLRHRTLRHGTLQLSTLRHGRRSARPRRVALGDSHPLGDIQSPHAPSLRPQWFAWAAVSQIPIDTEMAKCITTGLIDQDGGDSGSQVAESGKRSHLSEPASWKDPL